MGLGTQYGPWILPGQTSAGRKSSDAPSMSGRKRRQNWRPCSILTAPSTQSCKFWHQHCWSLGWLHAGAASQGAEGRDGVLVTGTNPTAPHWLQHRCLLLGSSQQGEVFSAKDHPLFPSLLPASESFGEDTVEREVLSGSHSPPPSVRCSALLHQVPQLMSTSLPSGRASLCPLSWAPWGATDAVRAPASWAAAAAGEPLREGRQQAVARRRKMRCLISRRVTLASASA